MNQLGCRNEPVRRASRLSVRNGELMETQNRSTLRRVALLAAAAIVLAVPTVGQAAYANTAAPGAVHSSQSEEEEYRDSSPEDALVGDTTGPAGRTSATESQSAQAAKARFIGRIDAHWPHVSSGQASGHVSWTLVSGTNRKLKVTSTLKARTSWFTFKTMAGPVPANVYAGGGRGKAAVARHNCTGTSSRDWYTYGEGFAPGTQKPFGTHSSDVKPLKCQ